MARVFAIVAACLLLSGCRTAVTACGTEAQAQESVWQLQRAGWDATVAKCGRGRLAEVPRWDAAEARSVAIALGLPRQRLEVPAPDAGLWPSSSGREMLQRHATGRRAAAVIRGLPNVEDAWVEVVREGSATAATATVVMREGEVDRLAVEAAVRGTQGLEGVGRLAVVSTRLQRVEAVRRLATVGPFRVDASQADALRWLVAGLLGLLSVAAGALAWMVRRRAP